MHKEKGLFDGKLEQPDVVQEPLTQEESNRDRDFELSKKVVNEVPYHERYYLKYHNGKRISSLDFDGTKVFLKKIGFDGGELLQARKGKEQSEIFRSMEKNKKNQMHCSYCGAEVAGVEYYRLPDGRFRCTACSRSIVSDKDEIQEMCNRVISNMENFFGATIDVPVSIEVLNERKLKKKVGGSLGIKDSQSILILGSAVNHRNNIVFSWRMVHLEFH